MPALVGATLDAAAAEAARSGSVGDVQRYGTAVVRQLVSRGAAGEAAAAVRLLWGMKPPVGMTARHPALCARLAAVLAPLAGGGSGEPALGHSAEALLVAFASAASKVPAAATSPALVADLTALLRHLIAARERAARAAGAPAGSHPPATATFNAVLAAYSAHGLPPAAASLRLGYRPYAAPASVNGAPLPPSLYNTAFPLVATAASAGAGGAGAAARRRTTTSLGPISAAAARVTAAALGTPVPVPLNRSAGSEAAADDAAERSDRVVVSESAHLWQARGGLWTARRNNPLAGALEAAAGSLPAPSGDDNLFFGAAPSSPVAVRAVDANAADDAVVAPTPALRRMAAHLRAHSPLPSSSAAPPGGSRSSLTGTPGGHHPALDVPPTRPHASPALRLLQGMWREMTGRLVFRDRVAVPPAGTPPSAPDPETLRMAYALCANAGDVEAVTAAAVADGVPLTGPALVTAMRQAVRFGDVQLGLAILDAAGRRIRPALQRRADAAAAATAAANTTPAPAAAVTGPLTAYLQLERRGVAGVTPRAAEQRTLPPPDALASAMGAVADGYDALVQAAAAAGAAVQALSVYQAQALAGFTPMWRTTGAALDAAATLGFPGDVRSLARSVLAYLYPAAPAAAPALSLGAAAERGGAHVPSAHDAAVGTAAHAQRHRELAQLAETAAGVAARAHSLAPLGGVVAGDRPAAVVGGALAALGSVGDVPALHDAWGRLVARALESGAALPGAVARGAIRGYAAAGELNAALAVARIGLLLGAPLGSEAALLPVLENVREREELPLAVAALSLMADAGIVPSDRSAAALSSAAARVAYATNLPVPDHLAAAAAAGAAAATTATPATIGLPSGSGEPLALPPRDDDVGGNAVAVGAHGSGVVVSGAGGVSSASGRAPTAVLPAILARYSAFTSTQLGLQLKAVLRGRLFDDSAAAAAAEAAATASPLALAAEASADLVNAIARWTVQYTESRASATAAAVAAARDSAAGGSAGVGAFAAPSAAATAAAAGTGSGSSIGGGSGSDGDGEDGYAVASELLLLALREWPVSASAAAAAASGATSDNVPAARADTLWARYCDALRDGGDAGAPVAPTGSLEAALAASLTHADFVARWTTAAPATGDVAEGAGAEAAARSRHRGRSTWVPATAFGPLRMYARWNADEDGSGLLGRTPVFRAPPPSVARAFDFGGIGSLVPATAPAAAAAADSAVPCVPPTRAADVGLTSGWDAATRDLVAGMQAATPARRRDGDEWEGGASAGVYRNAHVLNVPASTTTGEAAPAWEDSEEEEEGDAFHSTRSSASSVARRRQLQAHLLRAQSGAAPSSAAPAAKQAGALPIAGESRQQRGGGVPLAHAPAWERALASVASVRRAAAATAAAAARAPLR